MNFEEFLSSLKNIDLCSNYKNKLRNKYTKYIENEVIQRQQFITENGLSEEDFLSGQYDEWDYDWFYVGEKIEGFYTSLNLDFYSLASTKETTWSIEHDCCYKNYVIQDVWNELSKIESSEMYCYGIYIFSKILRTTGRQEVLRDDLQTLLSEMLQYRTEELTASEQVLSKYIKEYNGISCLFGDIKIDTSKGKLGQGGNGVVYAGKLDNTDLAVKFLINYSSKKLERFKAEFINTNMKKDKLENTVNCIHYEVLKIGEIEIPFIIMKKYNGSLKKYKKESTDLKWEDVNKLFRDLSKALKTLEENNIIHRDLKPENILIDENGNYIVSDFGIAHFESDDYPIKDLTKKSDRLANFEFAAPEQISGKNISFATDIYAFGQIIYWYVFGEVNRGTGGNNFEEVFMNKNQALILNKIVSKCIANNPKDRFQVITELEDYYLELQKNHDEINVYDDMHKFSNIVRSVIPECYTKVYAAEDKNDISNLVKKLASFKFNRPLEYNTGLANNQIEKFYEIENGNFILENREVIINKVWGLLGDSCYNDILILEVKNPKLYEIDGNKYSSVAVINSELIVPYDKIISGYYRFPDGHVENVATLNIEERFIYDDANKYIAIGTFHQCSIIQENDEFIRALQEYPELSKKIIHELKKHISMNMTYEVELGL